MIPGITIAGIMVDIIILTGIILIVPIIQVTRVVTIAGIIMVRAVTLIIIILMMMICLIITAEGCVQPLEVAVDRKKATYQAVMLPVEEQLAVPGVLLPLLSQLLPANSNPIVINAEGA